MKWSLQQLQKITKFPYSFKIESDFHRFLDEIKDTGTETDILDVLSVECVVSIGKIDFQTYKFDYSIVAKLLLECALTLEPVEYNMNLQISETYSKDPEEDMYAFDGNSIDTEVAVWSNIVINIPIRVVREDAYEILKERNITLDEIPDENE
jgi:uncharacterized protein